MTSQPFFHFSTRKVGGLRFVRLGRLSISFCLTSKPVKRPVAELPGTVSGPFTKRQAAAYRKEWAAHCDRMSAGY